MVADAITAGLSGRNDRITGVSVPVLVSVFLLSFSVFTLEIALTRIFSILVAYHFAFSIISIVMFGLGVGAILLGAWRRWFPGTSSSDSALMFTILTVASLSAIVLLPVVAGNLSGGPQFWLLTALAMLPFLAAGMVMADLYQEFAGRGSVVYGMDLVGGAVAALLVVVVLRWIGGVGTAAVSAAASALASILLSLGTHRSAWPRVVVATIITVLVVLVGLDVVQVRVRLFHDPDKEMANLLDNPEWAGEIVESRWSAFGRTDLIRSAAIPNEMILFTDGTAGSSMYELDAVLQDPGLQSRLLVQFGEFFPFWFLNEAEKNTALIIGPGGGRDVIVSLMGGVESITAVEVNPEIVQIVRDYADFNGGIYSGIRNVQVVEDEGRRFLETSTDTYDLIMLALPITKSSRSIGGYALTETYLFTTESMATYLDHLTPEGRIVIVAHGDLEIYRLIGIATAALSTLGIDEQSAMQHIYTIASGGMPTIVIKKEPFTPGEAALRLRRLGELGFNRGRYFVPFSDQLSAGSDNTARTRDLIRMGDQTLVRIESGQLSVDELINSAPIDISRVTDDRPFFYKFQRGLPPPFGGFAIAMAMIAVAGLWILLASRERLVRIPVLRKLTISPESKPFLLLFFALGAGFMVLEISIFQKLMKSIGQPVLALTVLLQSLLLGAAGGSLISGLLKRHMEKAIAILSCLIAIVAIPYGLFVGKWLLTLPFGPAANAVILVAPLGIALGFPYPLAIRLMKQSGLQRGIPVMWGVNGTASVFGSSLAMILAIQYGLSYSIAAGGAFYLVAAVGALLTRKASAGSNDPEMS